MSKDITERILLRAGFKYKGVGVLNIITDGHSIDITCVLIVIDEREWKCITYNKDYVPTADIMIQTVDHFNKLMELMDINFRIEE